MSTPHNTKILFVIGQLGIGGAERQLVYLASHLDKSRYEVLVCSLSAEAPLCPLLENSGIPTVILPQVMHPDLTRPFKLYHLIKSFQPDLIHSYLFVANTWSRIVGSMQNIPVILSERSSEPKKPFFITEINRLLSPLGTCVIANSQAGAHRIIQNKEFDPKKVFVIHNGLPLDNYLSLSNNNKHRLCAELGLSEQSRMIGIIARLSFPKNHKLLFDAFQLIQEQYKDIYLLCIGDGPLRDELNIYARKLGIQDSVIFTGIRNDIPECLSMLDVLVLPSLWEGLPNVILEAMAAKCPVIASDVGGVKEVITDGVTGWLTRPGDKYQLAEKIYFVLTNPSHVEKVKILANNFVMQNFSIDRMVAETEKIYESIL